MIWQCGERRMDLSERPLIMGVLNVTPDSFSDGYPTLDQALAQAEKLIADGADILDVGGESARPGARPVSASEEMDRVAPVIERLRRDHDLPISVDTQKTAVARAAIDAGADIVNHVSGSLDYRDMIGLLRETQVGYVCMHMQDRPLTMQRDPRYENVVLEVTESLSRALQDLQDEGVAPERALLDPGVGFGKTLAHNLTLLTSLKKLARHTGRPLLVGVSRKSWMTKLFADPLPDMAERDAYTALTSVMTPFPEVAIHRVHNVRWLKNAFVIKASLSRQE